MTRSNIPSLHKNGRSQQLVSVRSGGRRVQAREDAVPTCAAAGRQYFWCYRTVKVTWILRQERFILNLLGHSTEKKKVLLEMTLFMRFHDRSFSVLHVSIPKNSFVCWLAFSEPRCRQGLNTATGLTFLFQLPLPGAPHLLSHTKFNCKNKRYTFESTLHLLLSKC